MPTNSTYGWPIISKADMFKPSTQSALEGAAFDNRVVLERQRYETRVANTSALPSSGTFRGQGIWVDNRNRHYYWNGSAWKPANAFEVNSINLTGLSFVGNGGSYKWTAPVNVSLPSGRFSANPAVFTNVTAGASRGMWSQVVSQTTTSFTVRVYSTAPTQATATLTWVAFDLN